MALAQKEHRGHDHEDKPATAAEGATTAGKACTMDHAGMEGCMANKDGTMADGHKMDHAAMPMMDHGVDGNKANTASGDQPMSAEECRTKHEAMGHDPAQDCPTMENKAEKVTTQ